MSTIGVTSHSRWYRPVPGLVLWRSEGRIRALASIVAATLTIVPAHPQPIGPRGALLVATERTHDTGFAETVILVLQHNETRSVGLVVNRKLGQAVAALFPELRDAPGGGDPLWAGGPVALGVNAMVRSAMKPAGTDAILPGLYLASDRQQIDSLAGKRDRGTQVRVYVGLSSWGPRQLDDEIARGLWKSLPGSAAVVFDPQPDTLWGRLTKKAPRSR